MKEDQRSTILYWQEALQLKSYLIVVEGISRMQVMDEGGGVGMVLVGVAVNEREQLAIICTTEQLQEDDIVHELLHIRFPDWEHYLVVSETQRLISQEKQRVEGAILSPERI